MVFFTLNVAIVPEIVCIKFLLGLDSVVPQLCLDLYIIVGFVESYWISSVQDDDAVQLCLSFRRCLSSLLDSTTTLTCWRRRYILAPIYKFF